LGVDLQALGAIGEFVGGVAVIATLIYLAVQIRQNTKWLRSSVLAAVTDAYLAFNHLLGSSPAAARVFQVGLEDFERLSDDERRQFINLLRAFFGAAQALFLQHRRGAVDPTVWESSRDSVLALVQIPHVRAWWESRRMVFFEEFRRAIDEATPVRQPPLAAEVISRMLAATQEQRHEEGTA
jgi:hypothetical protein